MMLQSLGGQILGGLFATILLFVSDLPMAKYTNVWENDEIFAMELFMSFFISIVFFSSTVDSSQEKTFVYPFTVAGIYTAMVLALPNFGNGNMLRLFTGLNDDVGFVLCSIAGQIIGTLGGAFFYKFLLCNNNKRDQQEQEVSENQNKTLGV